MSEDLIVATGAFLDGLAGALLAADLIRPVTHKQFQGGFLGPVCYSLSSPFIAVAEYSPAGNIIVPMVKSVFRDFMSQGKSQSLKNFFAFIMPFAVYKHFHQDCDD